MIGSSGVDDVQHNVQSVNRIGEVEFYCFKASQQFVT